MVFPVRCSPPDGEFAKGENHRGIAASGFRPCFAFWPWAVQTFHTDAGKDTALIEFRNISKSFQGTAVLRDVGFSVADGKLVSVIGRSGCGKTTLLRMVNRLTKPTAGAVLIDGKNVESEDPIRLRRGIGYVIQQVGLFPHLTVRQNIEIIPKAEHWEQAKADAKCRELLAMVGLDPAKYLERYPNELSGGQQQRVGIARALAMDPAVILMDEPFSALDPITRANLQDQLLDLQAKMHKTIIFVTHDMDEAIKLSDMICIMRKGRVLQYDTPENILRTPVNHYVSEFVGRNRIWSSPEFIKIRDIMIDDPETTREHATVRRCLEKMREKKVDTLMVIAPDTKRFIGVVTAAALRQQQDLAAEIKPLLKKPLGILHPTQSIVEALRLVNEQGEKIIPVVTKAGILVGLVTRSSLITVMSQQYFPAPDDEAILSTGSNTEAAK